MQPLTANSDGWRKLIRNSVEEHFTFMSATQLGAGHIIWYVCCLSWSVRVHANECTGARSLSQVADPDIKISGPLVCAPIPRTKEQQEFDKEAMKRPPAEEINPPPKPSAAPAPSGGTENAQLAGLLQLLAQSQK